MWSAGFRTQNLKLHGVISGRILGCVEPSTLIVHAGCYQSQPWGVDLGPGWVTSHVPNLSCLTTSSNLILKTAKMDVLGPIHPH